MTHRILTPRRATDPARCVSGDRCPRPPAPGSRFCEFHRDELRRICEAPDPAPDLNPGSEW